LISCMLLISLLSVQVFAGGEAHEDGVLVQLKSISFGNGKVSFVAKSNGCTQAASFNLLIDQLGLGIVRYKKDRCRKMPQWNSYSLPFNFKESTSLNIVNSFFIK